MPRGGPKQLSGIKTCIYCKIPKEITSSFYFKSTSGTYDSTCKPCSNIKAKIWYAKNKERGKARAKAWIDKHRDIHYARVARWKKQNAQKILLQQHFRRVKVRTSGSISLTEWQQLLDKFGHKCLACQADDIKLTVDHIIPISKGGTNTLDNIQPLCTTCNKSKYTKIIDYRPLELICQVG